MATIEIWGGVGVIGSSKILIRDGGHRVLLDLGLDIPRDGDLFRAPAPPRPGRELADRLRVGAAPAIGGLFDPGFLAPGDPLAEPAEPTSVFISHPHIDHVGFAGFVRDGLPVHISPESAGVMRALAAAGAGLPGGDPDWIEIAEDAPVEVGPMRVERIATDHDVPGASGYLVHTADGTLAFTGDFRFHGHHPEVAWRFADRIAGAHVLVTEGTGLGWDETRAPRTEEDVDSDFAGVLDGNRDLVLMSIYPRDVDRVEHFTAIAAAAGRTIVWPDAMARFLEGVGIEAPCAIGAVGLDAIAAEPGRFVVQIDPDRIPDLLDLPIGAKTVLVHANGEPLGPFEGRWQLFTDWLAKLGVPLLRMGCLGHAYQDDLHEFVRRVAPKVLMPIHTTSPTRLHAGPPTTRVVVDYARGYDFAGRPVA